MVVVVVVMAVVMMLTMLMMMTTPAALLQSAFPSSRPLVVEKPTDCSPLLSVSLAVVAIALLLVLLSKLLLDGT